MQISAPAASGAPRPLRTGSCNSYCRELTPGLESWPPPVSLFLLVPFCAWERWGRQGTEASRGQQLPLSRAPGRGRGSSPRCTHQRVSTAAPPPEDQLEEQRKSKFLTKQHWKAPGEVGGFIVYRTKRSPHFLKYFSLFPLQLFLYQTKNFQYFSFFPP